MIRPSSALVSLVPLLALSSASALAAPITSPTHAITPEAPWARALDDELSKPLVEQWYGPEVARAWREIEPRWQDTTLLTRDSFDQDMLVTLGVDPLPAMNYEPSPGVVYVAIDGVTLRPSCGNGDTANSALDCSPLVNAETTFGAFGGGAAAAEFQQLATYYEEFDLVFTSNRPPDFLPYTMTVIGGSAGQVGLAGACGVANVACDGLKRNHVSLNFPDSCGGMAETAAQETSHNWGLEHTDNPTDLLYPFNNGGFKTFVDECMPISDATGDGITQCGYIHEIYCEAGAGEQQNSYAELMGVFGPRSVDDTNPEILSISPADGAVVGSGESIVVTAEITDDSKFVGVKWTWLEGLPEGLDSYTRCTNNTCDDDFNPGVSFDAIDMPWDFVGLDGAPPGTYSFQVEVLDAYGNYATQTVTFEVVEGPGGADTGGSGEGGVDESGGVMTGGDDLPGDTGGETGGGGDATGGDGGQDGGSTSGGCRTAAPAGFGPGAGGMLGLLLLLGVRRRRSSASA